MYSAPWDRHNRVRSTPKHGSADRTSDAPGRYAAHPSKSIRRHFHRLHPPRLFPDCLRRQPLQPADLRVDAVADERARRPARGIPGLAGEVACYPPRATRTEEAAQRGKGKRGIGSPSLAGAAIMLKLGGRVPSPEDIERDCRSVLRLSWLTCSASAASQLPEIAKPCCRTVTDCSRVGA